MSASMVGLPAENLSQELTRCLTPTLNRRKTPLTNHFSEGGLSSDKPGVKRWGSFGATPRRHLSAPNSVHGTFSYSGRRTWNDSPSTSDDEGDDVKPFGLLSPTKSRKLNSPSSLIGKLSPRLGRKFHKLVDHNENAKTAKDDNNNNNKTRHNSNTIAMGLSSTLLASAKFSETLICSPQNRNRLSSSSTTSSSTHSCENSACTSASGSIENLAICDHEMNSSSGSLTPTPKSCQNIASPPSTSILKEPKKEMKLHVKDYSSSEPFLLLCRGQLSRNRNRSRSPSHKIMNSFKKIRSLAVEHGNNGQGFSKQHQITSNGQNLLSVPIIKF